MTKQISQSQQQRNNQYHAIFMQKIEQNTWNGEKKHKMTK
jgi:hypothetical protein